MSAPPLLLQQEQSPHAIRPRVLPGPAPARPRLRPGTIDPVAAARERRRPYAPEWIRMQALNVRRHERALRPFDREEFGSGDVAPSDAHIEAVNTLIAGLRASLDQQTDQVEQAARIAAARPTPVNIRRATEAKERAHSAVMATEKVWDFYFELFGQRQGPYAEWLLSCDRIARDCYQAAFVRVGEAKSIPTPPPFSYMRTGFSPATYRRGIRLSLLGRQINPFPLIQLPYHRLVNPWTLGAVLHEVSHNLQNDLGLQKAVPLALARRLLAAGVSPEVTKIWARWNRETFADLSGLLLGGPSVVGSLMDVVGRSTESTLAFNPRGPHPTPYLRLFLSVELLRRMGFRAESERYRRAWTTLYPTPTEGTMPRALLARFPEVIALVVDTICYQRYPTLGNRNLAEVIPFAPQHQLLIEEAAGRLARGVDPGILPARYLIGATRIALERGLARAETIKENFYRELARR